MGERGIQKRLQVLTLYLNGKPPYKTPPNLKTKKLKEKYPIPHNLFYESLIFFRFETMFKEFQKISEKLVKRG